LLFAHCGINFNFATIMLKQLVAIMLIFFTMSANFSKLFIYAGYQANKKYIATSLCENRDKPWMHCNGKCYLLKKIKQAEEKEKSEEKQSGKNRFQEALVEQTLAINPINTLITVLHPAYHCHILTGDLRAIFHPPRVC
jgi:hypothetical protein